MIKNASIAVSIIFLIFLSEAFLGSVFGYYTPYLVLSSVIFFALKEGKSFGLFCGMFAGFLFEMLSANKFGCQLLSFGIVGFLVGIFKTTFFSEGFLSRLFLPLVGIGSFYFLKLIILRATNLDESFVFFDPQSLTRLLVTFLTTPMFFGFLSKFFKPKTLKRIYS